MFLNQNIFCSSQIHTAFPRLPALSLGQLGIRLVGPPQDGGNLCTQQNRNVQNEL